MVGLVLEGGAMRGMYTCGALDVFMEAGIAADKVVGVSAGALFGVNFLSGQRGRALRYNKRFNSDRTYLGLLPLLREGNIINTDYAYRRVPHELDPFDDETYRASGVPFYAVVTEVETAAPEYIRIDSVFEQMDVLRASGSMPMVSRPVRIGEKRYLDGGISDSIPYEWMAEQGCDKLIVVLTRDVTYRKKPMAKPMAGFARLRFGAIARRLAIRHEEYNEAVEKLAQWEQAGRAFVLRPSQPIHIGTIEGDPEKLQSVYDMGRADALACLERLKEYLDS